MKTKSQEIFEMCRAAGKADDLLLLNEMIGKRSKQSWLQLRAQDFAYWIESFQKVKLMECYASDMSSIAPLSGQGWIVISHSFRPAPWRKVIVMGSGLTHESTRQAYENALHKVEIPSRQWWMWWRRGEGRVDAPFIGAGMT